MVSNEEAKSIRRVRDIICKSKWNIDKMIKLATTMCKLTTSIEKIRERYNEVERILGSESEVTLIFEKRYKELFDLEPTRQIELDRRRFERMHNRTSYRNHRRYR